MYGHDKFQVNDVFLKKYFLSYMLVTILTLYLSEGEWGFHNVSCFTYTHTKSQFGEKDILTGSGKMVA